MHKRHIRLFIRDLLISEKLIYQAEPKKSLPLRYFIWQSGRIFVWGWDQTLRKDFKITSNLSLALNFFDLSLVAGPNYIYPGYVMAGITKILLKYNYYYYLFK